MRTHVLLSVSLLVVATAACVSPPSTSSTLGAGAAGSSSSGAGGSPSDTTSTSSVASTTAASSSTGTGTSTGANFSCEVKSAILHECTVYQNLTAAELTAQQEGCTSVLGTSGTTCSTVDAIGTCTSTVDGVTGIELWYSDGDTTAAEAQVECESALGTWKAGP